MLKIGYNAVYNYVYREKSLIVRICSSPMSHVLSDIQCIDICLFLAPATELCEYRPLKSNKTRSLFGVYFGSKVQFGGI